MLKVNTRTNIYMEFIGSMINPESSMGYSVYSAIWLFVITFLVKQGKQSYNILYEFIDKHFIQKFYIVAQIKTPIVSEYINYYLSKRDSDTTNKYMVQYDSYQTTTPSFKVVRETQLHSTAKIVYQNKIIYLLNTGGHMELRVPVYQFSRSVPFVQKCFDSNEQAREFLEEFIVKCSEDAKKDAADKILTKQRVTLYGWDSHKWNKIGEVPRRTKKSVVGDSCTKILKDVEKFIDDAAFYETYEIPYKRGYMLFGPPGTGKSTIIRTIATELNRTLYQVKLSDPYLTVESLEKAFAEIPNDAVIAIEDIDSSFLASDKQDKDNSDKNSSKITYSDILNILDGITSSYGNILFVTTNHIEKLGKSMIRPGRIDVAEEVTYFEKEHIIKFFLRFYPEEKERSKQFGEYMSQQYNSITPAELQNFIIKFRDQPDKCLESMDTFRDTSFNYIDWSKGRETVIKTGDKVHMMTKMAPKFGLADPLSMM